MLNKHDYFLQDMAKIRKDMQKKHERQNQIEKYMLRAIILMAVSTIVLTLSGMNS